MHGDTSSILDQSNSTGIYEFKVIDFDGREATATDILPDVDAADGVIGWPTNVTPVDGTIVTTNISGGCVMVAEGVIEVG